MLKTQKRHRSGVSSNLSIETGAALSEWKQAKVVPSFKSGNKLERVSSTYILMGRYNHSLARDATIMV